jgi:hypothetical protein
MMDKLDRMLQALPNHAPAPELAAQIQATVRRRHQRRQRARWAAASVLGIVGLWLIAPAVAWLSSSNLDASAAPWLLSSWNTINFESIQWMDGLWNGMITLQNSLGSSLAVSMWFGALLLCIAMFLTIDSMGFQGRPQRGRGADNSTTFQASIHN